MLSPIFSNISMVCRFWPWTTDTMMTTEATPMMMPSMVRKDRVFFMEMDLKAILKACHRFIPNPPPVRGPQ